MCIIEHESCKRHHQSLPSRLSRAMNDPVPAVAEADATGEIAQIFAEIRQVLGVGTVNLIWRHLATIPGALLWAWGRLRPIYIDGSIAGEAAKLRRTLVLPALPDIPAAIFAAADLSDWDLASIRSILTAYDRTNPMALIALSALPGQVDSTPYTHHAGLLGTSPAEPQVALPLPLLLTLADASPTTAELVLTLNRLGARRKDPVLASMYLHLAHWPRYLALAWAMIAPLDADGRLARAISNAVSLARASAPGIGARLPVLSNGALEPVVRTAVREALERFAGDVIPKMVVICALLREVSGSPREKSVAQ
jgi:hypothetical protein